MGGFFCVQIWRLVFRGEGFMSQIYGTCILTDSVLQNHTKVNHKLSSFACGAACKS